jgi:hypothetical protein
VDEIAQFLSVDIMSAKKPTARKNSKILKLFNIISPNAKKFQAPKILILMFRKKQN